MQIKECKTQDNGIGIGTRRKWFSKTNRNKNKSMTFFVFLINIKRVKSSKENGKVSCLYIFLSNEMLQNSYLKFNKVYSNLTFS